MPDPADNEFAHGTNHSNLKGHAEAEIWERVGVCVCVCVCVGGGGGGVEGCTLDMDKFQEHVLANISSKSVPLPL